MKCDGLMDGQTIPNYQWQEIIISSIACVTLVEKFTDFHIFKILKQLFSSRNGSKSTGNSDKKIITLLVMNDKLWAVYATLSNVFIQSARCISSWDTTEYYFLPDHPPLKEYID